MAGGWTTAETKALIDVWGESNVQSQLDNVRRNRDVYERVARELANQGWNKTWKQCRVKIKNLTQRYRKVRDGNNVSGRGRSSTPFYDEIDAILGHRAASQPVDLLNSGNNQGGNDSQHIENISEHTEDALIHNNECLLNNGNIDLITSEDDIVEDSSIDGESSSVDPNSSGSSDGASSGGGDSGSYSRRNSNSSSTSVKQITNSSAPKRGEKRKLAGDDKKSNFQVV